MAGQARKTGWFIPIMLLAAVAFFLTMRGESLVEFLKSHWGGMHTQGENVEPVMIDSGESAFQPVSPHLEKIQAQKALLRQPWGRDPFSPAGLNAVGKSGFETDDLVLTGIILRGEKRVAIVNRLFLREGDTVQGHELVRIEKGKAFLKKGDQEIVLRMGES